MLFIYTHNDEDDIFISAPDLVCKNSLGYWLTLAVWPHMTSCQGRDYQQYFVYLVEGWNARSRSLWSPIFSIVHLFTDRMNMSLAIGKQKLVEATRKMAHYNVKIGWQALLGFFSGPPNNPIRAMVSYLVFGTLINCLFILYSLSPSLVAYLALEMFTQGILINRSKTRRGRPRW